MSEPDSFNLLFAEDPLAYVIRDGFAEVSLGHPRSRIPLARNLALAIRQRNLDFGAAGAREQLRPVIVSFLAGAGVGSAKSRPAHVDLLIERILALPAEGTV